jgi:hypothetical protein
MKRKGTACTHGPYELTRSRTRSTMLLCTALTLTQTDAWRVRRPATVFEDACFLSHYKMEAGSDARYLADLLTRMLGGAPIFLGARVERSKRTHTRCSSATFSCLTLPLCEGDAPYVLLC